MRRIYIDDNIKRMAKEYSNNLLDYGPKQANSEPLCLQRLKAFNAFLNENNFALYASYVKEIADNLQKIITLTPNEFDEFHSAHFAKFTEDNLDLKKDIKNRPFYEHIVQCMGYEYEACKELMRGYIRKLKIKVCVYCNAQYAITTDEYNVGKKNKRISTYQLDHYYPKAKYPYLCVSFFNLQPCCSTCNQAKGSRKSCFNLYTNSNEEVDLDVFKFDLSPDKAICAYIMGDYSKFEIKLSSNDKELEENHNNLFHINLIYKEHLDVVVRIIVLLQWNNKYYQKSLRDSLGAIFPNGVEDPEYFFFGYYMDKKNIHRQPLSKLVQDIVAQLRS